MNLLELLQLSKEIPGLLRRVQKNSVGKPAVCMLGKQYASRNPADVGTVEFYSKKKIKLKGVGGKPHEDGPEGQVFVKTFTSSKKLMEEKRICM